MGNLKQYSLSIGAGLVLGLAVQFSAAAEVVHFGTGVGGTIGQLDPNVTFLFGTGVAIPVHPVVVQPYPGGYSWAAPFAQTQWVAAALDGNGLDSAYSDPGRYVFALHFNLPADFQAPSLSLQYYADNAVSSVLLNGNALVFTGADQQVPGHAETANAAFFMAGDNLLNIAVENWSTQSTTGTSPLGLDLQGVVSFVPEPTSGLLLVLGLGLLGLCRRKV